MIKRNKQRVENLPSFNGLDDAGIYRNIIINKAEEVFGLKFSILDCDIKTFTTGSGFKFFTFFGSFHTPESPSGRVVSSFYYETYEIDFLPIEICGLN